MLLERDRCRLLGRAVALDMVAYCMGMSKVWEPAARPGHRRRFEGDVIKHHSSCAELRQRGGQTCRGHCRLSSGQAEAVLDVGGQEVVAAVLVLIALQVLVDLIDQ